MQNKQDKTKEQKKDKKEVKIDDLKPVKDAKGGGGHKPLQSGPPATLTPTGIKRSNKVNERTALLRCGFLFPVPKLLSAPSQQTKRAAVFPVNVGPEWQRIGDQINAAMIFAGRRS